MTSNGYRRPNDPIDALRDRIAQMEATIRDLSTPGPFRIPVLPDNPPETDPTNLWLLADGRLRSRYLNSTGTAYVYKEYSPIAPTGTTPPPTAPPPAAPITYTSSFGAIWSQSYRQSGPARTDDGTKYLYYGSSGDSFNGRNRSLIGFNYGSIASALDGSTVKSVQLNMTNIHAYWNNGVDIYFGIHNFTSEPSSWAGGGIPRSMITKQHFGKPQNKWITLPIEFATRIRDNTGKGIAIEAPSSSRDYYGFAAGVGSGYATPTLKITYVK